MGPYLSQMGQYGYQSLTYRDAIYVVDPQPPQSYKSDDVWDLIWTLIDDKFPEPDENGGRILYMVFMPPGTAGVDWAQVIAGPPISRVSLCRKIS